MKPTSFKNAQVQAFLNSNQYTPLNCSNIQFEMIPVKGHEEEVESYNRMAIKVPMEWLNIKLVLTFHFDDEDNDDSDDYQLPSLHKVVIIKDNTPTTFLDVINFNTTREAYNKYKLHVLCKNISFTSYVINQ